jgi:ubiquinone/menaquinone biosynthesis C-methylase UbiE
MAFERDEFIEKQKEQWNGAAPAWEKWDSYLDANFAFVSARLVGDARLRKGQQVLDLGSGTGYPAILAGLAVGAGGSVTGLDISEEMLSLARRKARDQGLVNVTFRAGDVSALGFDDKSFDAVLSRFCLMFLPDVPGTLKEIARVLKPGGYLAAAVWSVPEKNPFITIPIKVLSEFMDIPAPEPGTPGIFQLARAGDLLGMAEKAGLNGLAEEEMIAKSRFESAGEYLENLMDLAAPLKPLFSKLSSDQRKEAEANIIAAAGRYGVGDHIELPMAFRVVTACKG